MVRRMEEYELLITEIFSKTLEKVDNRIRVWAEKVKFELKTNPYNGKQLRFEWFREQRFENYRLYYFVSEEPKRVLAIILAPKKDQDSS